MVWGQMAGTRSARWAGPWGLARHFHLAFTFAQPALSTSYVQERGSAHTSRRFPRTSTSLKQAAGASPSPGLAEGPCVRSPPWAGQQGEKQPCPGQEAARLPPRRRAAPSVGVGTSGPVLPQHEQCVPLRLCVMCGWRYACTSWVDLSPPESCVGFLTRKLGTRPHLEIKSLRV